MKLSDFDYDLPDGLIAVSPSKPRDHSRLLVVGRRSGRLAQGRFFNIIDYFEKGDVLVLNNSKVIPARLVGKKASGGAAEVFLSRRLSAGTARGKVVGEKWECLVKGKRLQPGAEIIFSPSFSAVLDEKNDATWTAVFNKKGADFKKALKRFGRTPLPPYIPARGNEDKKSYQTVYADDAREGSVAAPTAGLHFTAALLVALKKKGVIVKYITLHVGLGTFLPIRVEDPRRHAMHAEWVEVGADAIKSILKTKLSGRKVFAAGTTTTRSLEAAFASPAFDAARPKKFSGWVDIFIYPPYTFKAVDAMITNFHLPKSTLLMLVSAFASRSIIKKAYAEAIREKYRFYSFGDAMLII